jgi:uncharacterized membrane protein HdeD (DUF308 family)
VVAVLVRRRRSRRLHLLLGVLTLVAGLIAGALVEPVIRALLDRG